MIANRAWRLDREWATITAASAACVTMLDAALLQLRRDYFTGGFLSTDHATGWIDRVAFVVGSLMTDAVLAGAGVWLALMLAGRARLSRLGRWLLAVVAGAAPLGVATLVEYEVLARLGEAFDLSLMFDLVGQRPSELLAVAAAHLVVPVLAALLAIVLVGATAWLLTRRYPSGVRVVAGWPLAGAWLCLALVGTATMTAMRISSDVLDNGLRRKPSGQALGWLVDEASDVDRDGFGVLGRPPDVDSFNARVYPYALDLPANGVDEDGVAGDLPDGPSYTEPSGAAPVFAQTPDVVIVMLETFRADLVGLRHEGRDVTPVLNALASEGAASKHAYSHNGYTVQSRYHLFTGSLAGLRGGTTLIDDFKANGYEVGYFSAQDESFGGPLFDVGTGRADVFYDARQDRDRRFTTFATAGSLGVSADVLLERVDAFLDSRRDAARPLFLYVNFYDTHFPYHHDGMRPLVSSTTLAQAEIAPDRASALQAMYRNAAANVDAAIGRLLASATARRGAPPAVLVLADHGESLFDEGFLGHGYALDEVQTRIPLVVRGLSLDLCEPVGQADLRDAIGAALSRADLAAPRFRPCEDKQVFQYLGVLRRPPEIGRLTSAGRLTYDFRRDRARVDAGPWGPVAALPSGGIATWTRLVHFWERLRLAQADGIDADVESGQ